MTVTSEIRASVDRALAVAPTETWTVDECLQFLSLLNTFVASREGNRESCKVVRLVAGGRR
jgi:hypothetical protein